MTAAPRADATRSDASRPDAPTFSFVREYPAADPAEASRHFLAKLSVETDASDVHADLTRGARDVIVIDARQPQAHAECRVPGAVSLPHRQISAETTRQFSKDATLVTYCWGPGCNASTKAAAKLAALGFRVKEMIGGIEHWRLEGYPVDGTLGKDAPLHGLSGA